MKKHLLLLATTLLLPSVAAANNNVYITPYIGYSFTNGLSDVNGINVEAEDDVHYAVGLMTDLYNGRTGLYLSHQPTDFANITGSGSLTYAHLQSALYWETFNKATTYFGASLGATIIDADWSTDDLLFSAGLFGGIEFHLTQNLAVNLEGRWLASLVDSDTTTRCTLPTGEQDCNIRIDSEWMNQIQTNLGITYSF